MKLFTAIIMTSIFGQVALASTHNIKIPMPRHHELYYGSVEGESKVLKKKLISKAIALCGSEEEIGIIRNIEVTVTLVSLTIIEGAELPFEGAYPLSSLSAELKCVD